MKEYINLIKLCLPTVYVNILGFLITAITKTHKLVDLTGSLGFLSICANLYYVGFFSTSSPYYPYQTNVKKLDDRRFIMILLISLWGK